MPPDTEPKNISLACADSELGHALFRVMRAIMFHDPPVPELDALPLSQLRLLMMVHKMRDATMKDFSEIMQVSQSTVTQLADRLVQHGLIERHSDTNDRRIVRLRTSPAGKSLMAGVDEERRATLDSICHALSAEQQAQIVTALEALGTAAEAIRSAQGRPVPPLHHTGPDDGEDEAQENSQSVVDLMSRRVRGKKFERKP